MTQSKLGTRLAIYTMAVSLCVGGVIVIPPRSVTPVVLLDPADEIRLLGVYIVDTDLGAGSGFSVSDTIIVTAHHVICGAATISVDGEVAELLASDPVTDVAVLRVPSRSRPHLKFADPARGDATRAVGYARYRGDGWPMIVKGHVAGFADGHVTVTGGLGPGMSGGPLLDTEGRVIGLAAHVFLWQPYGPPNPTLSNFVPTQWIMAVLAETPFYEESK